MLTGIDHATALATARSSRNRAVRCCYQNLAAYWRLMCVQHRMRGNRPAVVAAVEGFTATRGNGQIPA